MPEEVRAAKTKELKELKRNEKDKKEAEKFETRYKKIKFFEKKKVIRKLEALDKALPTADESAKAEMEAERTTYKNYLTYVSNFPANKKYISLFPTAETDKSGEQRDQMMSKILKMSEVKSKLRLKELLEMDNEADALGEEKVEKKVKQLVQKKDAFFTLDEADAPVEKKVV